MADRYLTLAKVEPEFESYLTGKFSRGEVAIPIHSLDLAVDPNKVTFHIRPRTEVKGIEWLNVLSRLFRFQLLPMSLSQVLVVGLFAAHLNPTSFQFFQWQWVLAALSLASLQSSIFAFNDFVDHIKGHDRYSDRSGSRVIQSGYLAAHQVFSLATAMGLLALVFAVPLVISDPRLLVFGILAFAFGVFGYTLARSGLSRILVGGLSVFLVFGPLLVLGSAMLFKIEPDFFSAEILFWLSIAFGWAVSIYSRIRQLDSIMVDAQAGLQTFATRLGFDRAKKLLCADEFLFQFFIIFFWWRLGVTNINWILPLALFAIGLRFVRRIWLARSPLGSITQSLPSHALYIFMTLSIALSLEFIWLRT